MEERIAERLLTLADLRRQREVILTVAARYGARDIRVFGSVARGASDAASDIDLLVRLEQGRSLLDLAGLHLALEDLLGCRVDVVTEGGLRRPRFRERVLAEAIPL